jgi:capsular polysaccharide export protein
MFKFRIKKQAVVAAANQILYKKLGEIGVSPEEYQRKLSKLVRDPKRFFADSKQLSFVNSWFDFDEYRSGDERESALVRYNAENQHLGLDAFDLIGENWISDDQKPIAFLWGFHAWKREYVSSYLKEYRTAYSNTKRSWTSEQAALRKVKKAVFIFWGMTGNPSVISYAQNRGFKILRMEDGFIRSSDLGSKRTMPMSLVLDDMGIYFDATRPSRLENILQSTDFTATEHLLDAAEALLKVFKALEMSKYNIKSCRDAADILGVKFRQRILVIGQVPDDASLLYGDLQGWDDQKLIELAIQENPDCEIVYKPHPDILEGFRKSEEPVTTKDVVIINERVSLPSLFRAVDKVYTITSLSGFEALIYGLPVTVVGMPFYAGWGLTDDRASIPRRHRTLTLVEIFCATYLLYPRYLLNLDESIRGCLSSMFYVAAESSDAVMQEVTENPTHDAEVRKICATPYWPVLFRPAVFSAIEPVYNKKLYSVFSAELFFLGYNGDSSKETIAYFLTGKMNGKSSFGRFLKSMRPYIPVEVFSQIIKMLWDDKPTSLLLEQYAWASETSGNYMYTQKLLDHLAFSGDYKSEEISDRLEVSLEDKLIPPSRFAFVLKLAQFELKQRNLDESKAHFQKLLLSGYVVGDVFVGLADIARLKFDYLSASEIMRFYNIYEPQWKIGRAHIQESIYSSVNGDAPQALQSLVKAININPAYVESTATIERVFNTTFGVLPYSESLATSIVRHRDSHAIGVARALISTGESGMAEQVLLRYKPLKNEVVRYSLILSSAYIYQNKLSDARRLIESLLDATCSVMVYREALRLSIIQSDYAWGEELLKESILKGFSVGDIYHRKIRIGLGDIKGSYLSFRQIRANKIISTYFGEKYIQSVVDSKLDETSTVLALAFFGPGDEIRFASKYSEIYQKSTTKNLKFSCDPRLATMLSRSYPEIEFVPVARLRSLNNLKNRENYNLLPGSDLHIFMDNTGFEKVNESQYVTLVTDVLGDVVGDYESFRGLGYLLPDPNQVSYWAEAFRPKTDKHLVGISWRSSLNTYSRSEHYLSVQDLVPVFELDFIQFVNFQYDECSQELQWIEERYPGKIIHFAELDHFNDLEGVAALMRCMDLMISPATTVVELAGAVGVPTLLVSNSSELHWRKKPGTVTDVWHNSIQHVEGSVLGNKASVVEALVQALKVAFRQ